jgi:peptidyl-prolyl cis-trans isomerase SurA
MARIFMAALAAVLLISSAAQAATLIDRIVAIVGSDVVTQSELDLEMAPKLDELNRTLRGDDLADAKRNLREQTLNLLIDKKLQLQEAKVEGIKVDDKDIDAAIKDIKDRNKMDDAQFEAALAKEGYTLAGYRESLRDQLTIIRLVGSAVRSKIVLEDAEVKKYYDEHPDEFTQKDSVRVANILFPAKDGDMEKALADAKAAKAELDAGTISFEDMAVKCTGDPGASKSCVLGTFGEGELSKKVEGIAFSMKAGEVSEPIEAPNGYQLIKVMDRTYKKVKPFDDVKGDIVEKLSVAKGQELFAKWIQDLRDRSYVEIRK